MKITESKLRQMIRGVIREFTSGATGTGGAERKGYQSAERKSAQSDFDAKVTAASDAAAAVDKSKKYRRQNPAAPPKKGQPAPAPTYSYNSTAPTRSWTLNPDWTTQNNAANAAKAARDSAETTLDTAKASDLEKTVPTKKQQTGGGGVGFGKGKSAGKGKGKKKKN